MPATSYNIEGLDCLCCRGAAAPLRISYILYPMDILNNWIAPAADKFGTAIAVITGMDWDNDLTPWPAEGVPRGCPDFQGLAQQFLTRIERLCREVEGHLGVAATVRRDLVGVSLSGLFTLWQWPQTDLFTDIACMSGSFWYSGFLDWFEAQDFSGKRGKAYFSLGDKESGSKVKAFDSVGANTAAIVASLKAQGVDVQFQSVPGTHYQNALPRLNLAMAALHQSAE